MSPDKQPPTASASVLPILEMLIGYTIRSCNGVYMETSSSSLSLAAFATSRRVMIDCLQNTERLHAFPIGP